MSDALTVSIKDRVEKVKFPEQALSFLNAYCEIPKISPGGLYFSKALFEGLIFGGAYIRRGLSTEGNLCFKIDWASLIVGRKFTIFALCYIVFEGNFQVQAPRDGGAYNLLGGVI